MAAPLLETKLHVPRLRRGLVARPQLSGRLSRGVESALTLVSAPAGFGKTTLLTEWLASSAAGGGSTAWVSLDHRDNDPALFWTYVVEALRAATGGAGARALLLLQTPQPLIEEVLATLLNDLQGIAHDVVLVLDDYHVIEAREVHDGMGFLVEHLPSHVHLVIAGRADPPLPLARMRARGELAEIRAADLRFGTDEAAAYLNGAMGLELTATDVAALEDRTEGWVAALQLAALSMQGRDDVAAFIAGFAGDDRYIVDYLAEEVLHRQPDDVRDFLLQTSILDRLSGPLCDAVTGQAGGRARLAELERGNLFLVPLDDRRHWYRYHHLFADVLQARLLDEQAEQVPELHRRASRWYEDNGERSEAVRHALAGADFGRAADLVELAWPVMRQARQEPALLGWLRAIPDEVIRCRPVLCLAYAGVLLTNGIIDGIEERLVDAERCLDLDADDAASIVVVDQDEFRRVPAAIALYRAALALTRGDLPAVSVHAARVSELTTEDDHLERGGAAGLLGLAFWTTGDLESGHRYYSECVAHLHAGGSIADIHGCSVALADIRTAQGRLRDAMRTFVRALQITSAYGGGVLRGTPDMHTGMSALHRERDEVAAATDELARSQELGEHVGLPQNRYRWRVAMARICEAQGDLDGALDLVTEAERLYVGDFFPDVRPVPAMKARLRVVRGELDEAVGWARDQRLAHDDDLSYLREFEHVTLARVLLAQFAAQQSGPALDEALGLLRRLLAAAEEGGRNGTVIEILVLQALAEEMRGDVAAALVPLERALALAEPEGYVRVFADAGPPMATLLAAAAERGIAPSYVSRLRSALGSQPATAPAPHRLAEPLSERELGVLRLLRTELGGPEIADQLVVSLHTVRSHTKKIYAKLGVNNRRAAVRRAEELGLLS